MMISRSTVLSPSHRSLVFVTALLSLGAVALTRPASAVTWSPRALVNQYAAGDFYPDASPGLATDGHGNWIAVWDHADFFDHEIAVSRSSDNGYIWSAPTTLNTTAAADGTSFDLLPQIAADGNGNWIAVWSSRWNPGAGIASSDYDILAARSTDNGATWSVPVPVNGNHASDAASDYFPRIATDRGGNWIVTWTAISASPQQQHVLTARSSDHGSTWGPVVAPSSEPVTLGGLNNQPRIATDEFGTWMLVTYSDNILGSATGTDYDVIGWRSTNNGSSWSAPFAINGNAMTDSGDDGYCDVATDGTGTWMVAWDTASLPGTADFDIAVSRSTDDGLSWSSPALVNPSAAVADAAFDSGPVLAASPFGGWIVAWNTTAFSGTDLVSAWSADDGANWNSPAPLNSNVGEASGSNAVAGLVPAMNGEWLALWSSTDAPLSSNTEPDIFTSRATFFTGVAPEENDSYDTGDLDPSVSGYAPLGFNIPGLAHPEYSTTAGAYLAHIAADSSSPTRVRASGVYSASSKWLRYSSVGSGRYVRASYHVYAGGQSDPEARNSIPNLRIRAGLRFAQTSILEVFNHLNMDPGAAPFAEELRPSQDPARPSIYRVDLDPVDVPVLEANAAAEGVLRGFEAYSFDPQDNGYLALTESSLGTYLAVLPQAGAPLKVYAPTPTGAGTLAATSPGECTQGVFIPNGEPGVPLQRDESLASAVTITEGPFGVTLDTSLVPADRIGIACREFFPGSDPTASDYVRTEPGKQYLVRFHLTSTRTASDNAQIRCRARSVKWNWVQRFEIGGAWAIGTDPRRGNAAIAQQSLPGFGCLNPDQRTRGERGGWYTLLMHSPLSPDLRAESDGTLAEKMPRLANEPGPGEAGSSMRDLKLGLDLIDTISPGPFSGREQGNVTVDRIEVYSTRLVED